MSKIRLIFAVLNLVCLLIIAAGCTSSTGTAPAATPPTPQIVYVTVLVTPTPNALTQSIKTSGNYPIIGVWRLYDSSDGYDDRYRFNADGTYAESYFMRSTGETLLFAGTWSANNDNSYTLSTYGKQSTIIYSPGKNAIYDSTAEILLLTPYQGDVAAASKGTPTGSNSASYPSSGTSPSTLLSGTGDDVQSFQATGSGLYIFTMRYSGKSNFAVVLKDGQGGYMDLLANEIGSYSGRKSAQLTYGKYYLDVTASGPWTVSIST